MRAYRSHDLPQNAEAPPGLVIDYDEVLREQTTAVGHAEPQLTRREALWRIATFAAGLAAAGALVGSVRRSTSPTGLTEAQLAQIDARVDKEVQHETMIARSAEIEAERWSTAFNNAMDRQIVHAVPMLPGAVRIGQDLFVRNPLLLAGPNETAHTLEQFMRGLYFGVLEPGAPDALVKIVPKYLVKSSMVYAPDDPNSTNFISYVNVRVSSVGIGGLELLAVDDANKPLVEPDGVTWMRLCVPPQ